MFTIGMRIPQEYEVRNELQMIVPGLKNGRRKFPINSSLLLRTPLPVIGLTELAKLRRDCGCLFLRRDCGCLFARAWKNAKTPDLNWKCITPKQSPSLMQIWLTGIIFGKQTQRAAQPSQGRLPLSWQRNVCSVWSISTDCKSKLARIWCRFLACSRLSFPGPCLVAMDCSVSGWWCSLTRESLFTTPCAPDWPVSSSRPCLRCLSGRAPNINSKYFSLNHDWRKKSLCCLSLVLATRFEFTVLTYGASTWCLKGFWGKACLHVRTSQRARELQKAVCPAHKYDITIDELAQEWRSFVRICGGLPWTKPACSSPFVV